MYFGPTTIKGFFALGALSSMSSAGAGRHEPTSALKERFRRVGDAKPPDHLGNSP